jgi:hypothetical protein
MAIHVPDGKSCDCCKRRSPALHEHHIFMASLNGQNSPTCNLCGDCHQSIHSLALHQLACFKRNKPTTKGWPTDRPQVEIDAANLLIHALVKEMQTKSTDHLPKQVGKLELSPDLNRALIAYAKDHRINKQRAILALIEQGLRSRGYHGKAQDRKIVR